MASKRKTPSKSNLARNVEAALRGAKSAITAGKAAAAARAKKARARANAQELQRIENLLGEDFDSLAQAKRALARETQRVTKKQAAAFKAKQQKTAPAAPATPRKRRPAPAGPTAPPAPKPAPAPAGPRLPDRGDFSLGALTTGTLPEVLDKLESGLAEQLDKQLRPGEELRVTVFGRGTKHQRYFQSFRQVAQYTRRYIKKGFHNWSPGSQQNLLANIRIVRSAPDSGPAAARAERVAERQAEVARVKAKYPTKTLLETSLEETARLRVQNAEMQAQLDELKAMLERLTKGQK